MRSMQRRRSAAVNSDVFERSDAPSGANSGVASVQKDQVQPRAVGKVLRFEVRFGEAAVSRRMPRGVPTCMLQVNLDNVSHIDSAVSCSSRSESAV